MPNSASIVLNVHRNCFDNSARRSRNCRSTVSNRSRLSARVLEPAIDTSAPAPQIADRTSDRARRSCDRTGQFRRTDDPNVWIVLPLVPQVRRAAIALPWCPPAALLAVYRRQSSRGFHGSTDCAESGGPDSFGRLPVHAKTCDHVRRTAQQNLRSLVPSPYPSP